MRMPRAQRNAMCSCPRGQAQLALVQESETSDNSLLEKKELIPSGTEMSYHGCTPSGQSRLKLY